MLLFLFSLFALGVSVACGGSSGPPLAQNGAVHAGAAGQSSGGGSDDGMTGTSSGSSGAGRAGGAASQGDAGQGGDGGPPSPKTCVGRPFPKLVPPDWVEWTGWSCACSVYYPAGGPTAMPSLAWSSAGPLAGGVVYERAVYPAPGEDEWNAFGEADDRYPQFDVQRDVLTGHPAVQIGFLNFDQAEQNTTVHFVVFDLATNRPLNAMVQASAQDCGGRFSPRGIGGGRQVVFLSDTSKMAGPFGASVATSGGWVSLGQGGESPAMGTRIEYPDADFPSLARPVATGVVEWRNSGFFYVPWGGSASKLKVSSPDRLVRGPGGAMLFLFPFQGAIPPVAGWSPSTGVVPQILSPPQGKSDDGVATDGVDIVWDRIPSDWMDASPGELMSAPFSLDAAVVLKATKVIKVTPRYSESAVGCGLSARQLSSSHVLEVVRLNDGGYWQIAETATEKRIPLFLDCDTLYVKIETGSGSFPKRTFGRIRLDSLGPPTLPN